MFFLLKSPSYFLLKIFLVYFWAVLTERITKKHRLWICFRMEEKGLSSCIKVLEEKKKTSFKNRLNHFLPRGVLYLLISQSNIRKGEKSKFHCRYLANTTLANWSMLTASGISHADSQYRWCVVTEASSSLRCLSPNP